MKNETIVDRVVERIKQQPLGDLITEEDLHDIVKEAIPRAFFEKRFVDPGGYGNKRELEPAIVEVMRGLLREGAEKAVAAWLVANAETVAAQWKAILDASVASYVQKVQDEKTSAHVREMLRGYFEEINKQRQSAGLMPIYI